MLQIAAREGSRHAELTINVSAGIEDRRLEDPANVRQSEGRSPSDRRRHALTCRGSMLGSRRVMFSDRRGSGKRFASGLALALLLPASSACAPAVGGGVLVAVVGIGALTSHCYDYIDVTVYDAQGRRTCAATVTATNRSDQFELESCYYAPLTDGHWTIRAALPGLPDAVSSADVEHTDDCTRHVLSMELTINAPGSRSTGSATMPQPPPPDVPALPPPPAAPPGAPASSPTGAASSAAPVNSSAPPAPSSAPPTVNSSAPPAPSSAPPSLGVFPDQSTHPSPAK
jgi:hypothetical protein